MDSVDRFHHLLNRSFSSASSNLVGELPEALGHPYRTGGLTTITLWVPFKKIVSPTGSFSSPRLPQLRLSRSPNELRPPPTPEVGTAIS